MKVGDLVFSKCQYSNKPVIFAGPALVTRLHNMKYMDIIYLNNPHTDDLQGLGHAQTEEFMSMEYVPQGWEDNLAWWVTRALISYDTRQTGGPLSSEVGPRVVDELNRLGVS